MMIKNPCCRYDTGASDGCSMAVCKHQHDIYRCSIITMYEHLIKNTVRTMSSEENSIITNPDIGTVKDGGRAYYTEELRRDLMLLLETYSTESTKNWDELRSQLQHRLDTDLNYNTGISNTETISRNWATTHFVKTMDVYRKKLLPDTKRVITLLDCYNCVYYKEKY